MRLFIMSLCDYLLYPHMITVGRIAQSV